MYAGSDEAQFTTYQAESSELLEIEKGDLDDPPISYSNEADIIAICSLNCEEISLEEKNLSLMKKL